MEIHYVKTIPDFEPSGERTGCVRTRELLKYLMIDLVGVKNCLPSNVFSQKFDAVKYPSKIVKEKSYSEFGIQLERFIAIILFLEGPKIGVEFRSSRNDFFKKHFENCTVDAVRSLVSPDLPLEEAEKIAVATIDFFKRYPESIIFYGSELKCGSVLGHPDFILRLKNGDIIIFDVKVFARTVGGKDNRLIRSQLAMYVALARHEGFVCNTVGVIMPWMRRSFAETYSVEKWKSTHLIEASRLAACKVIDGPANAIKWVQILKMYNIGSHIEKSHAISLAKSNVILHRPFQIFLFGNACSAEQERKGVEELATLISPGAFKRCRAYVHAPYNLNLATRNAYVVDSAVLYLTQAQKYGFRGVVFHVGHCENELQGTENMMENLKKISEKINFDEQTFFLLETPCGNKNELLDTPQKFSTFLEDVKKQIPKFYFSVCVDTCHVHCNGYQPMDYLNILSDVCKSHIRLIHFNGSRKELGSRADGHAHVTFIQKIPNEQLCSVVDFAMKNSIDCVTE